MNTLLAEALIVTGNHGLYWGGGIGLGTILVVVIIILLLRR